MAYELAGPRLKLKHRRGGKSTNKSGSSNSGASKHRGETDKNRLKSAQEQTRVNQKVLVLVGGTKRTWRRVR